MKTIKEIENAIDLLQRTTSILDHKNTYLWYAYIYHTSFLYHKDTVLSMSVQNNVKILKKWKPTSVTINSYENKIQNLITKFHMIIKKNLHHQWKEKEIFWYHCVYHTTWFEISMSALILLWYSDDNGIERGVSCSSALLW